MQWKNSRKRLWCYLIGVTVLIGSCDPPERVWTIQYRVIRTNGQPGEFTVEYTANNAITKSEGLFSGEVWDSPELKDMPSGMLLEFAVKNVSGNGAYEFFIKRDGAVHAQGELSASETVETISIYVDP